MIVLKNQVHDGMVVAALTVIVVAENQMELFELGGKIAALVEQCGGTARTPTAAPQPGKTGDPP